MRQQKSYEYVWVRELSTVGAVRNNGQLRLPTKLYSIHLVSLVKGCIKASSRTTIQARRACTKPGVEPYISRRPPSCGTVWCISEFTSRHHKSTNLLILNVGVKHWFSTEKGSKAMYIRFTISKLVVCNNQTGCTSRMLEVFTYPLRFCE